MLKLPYNAKVIDVPIKPNEYLEQLHKNSDIPKSIENYLRGDISKSEFRKWIKESYQ